MADNDLRAYNDVKRLEAYGRWADAAAAWRNLLSATSDPQAQLEIRANLARCLWHDGDLDDAEDALNIALHALTDDTPAEVRGQLLVEQGRLHESAGRFHAAHSRYMEARDQLGATQGQSAEAQLLVVRLARETGDIAEALEAVEALQFISLSAAQRAKLLSERAALEMYSGRFEAAVALLNDSLTVNLSATDYQQAYTRLLLAECYVSMGRGADADEELRAARNVFDTVQDHRGNSEAFELLGRLGEARQDYHKAARAYHDGLEHDVRSQDVVGQARAYRHLARCYRQLGEYANAESALDDAEQLLPAEHHLERAALYTEQGHLACEKSNYDDAMRQFRNAIDLVRADRDTDPVPFARAQRGLARALREDSQLKSAQQLLEETVQRWPEGADRREYDDLLDDLAEVYLDADAFQLARDTLLNSLKIGDAVGTVHSRGRTQLLLSRAFFALGDRAEAHNHLAATFASMEHDGSESSNTSWRADALMQRGTFALADNQIHIAVDAFAGALKIANRRGDGVRIARAQRELAACYRLRGDFKRAEDYLEFAEDELRDVDDRMEAEMLVLERARLDIAQWQHSDVERKLKNARQFFASRGSAVRAARCDRLLARLAFQTHRSEESLTLLDSARRVFDQCGVSHELDDTYDDIAEVHLQAQELEEAEKALDNSYQIDKRIQWRTGGGRTQLLRAELALRRSDPTRARQLAEDALAAFEDSHGRDETRSAGAHIMLGDCALAEGRHALAIEEYRKARRLGRGIGDQLGMAVAYQRLGLAYTLDEQYARAEESFDQADDYLESMRVVRLMAPLARDRGRLAIDGHNDYVAAISLYERALRLFQEMNDVEGVNDIYQRLIAAHQARNNHDEAFKYMQAMGIRHASMWTMLTKELDVAISDAAAGNFAHKAYRAAVTDAFDIVEGELRKSAAEAGIGLRPTGQPDTTIGIQILLRSWLSGKDTGLRFTKDNGNKVFLDLCIAAFEFVRNPLSHPLEARDLTAQQAFMSLSLANLIMTVLRGAR